MKALFVFIIASHYCFGQVSNPICTTDSCRKKFILNTVKYGSFPMQCVRINFKDTKGNKWSEMVPVILIHNYYAEKDSSNKKKHLDSLCNVLYNGGTITKDTSRDRLFGGNRIDEKIYQTIVAIPFERQLTKYFDREGNILKKFEKYTTEILASCYSNNVTLMIDKYYYPAIDEATWEKLLNYYPQLTKLPKPLKSRYYN